MDDANKLRKSTDGVNMKVDLTKKEREVMDWLNAFYLENPGKVATVRVMMRQMGYKSPCSPHVLLSSLKKKGMVEPYLHLNGKPVGVKPC